MFHFSSPFPDPHGTAEVRGLGLQRDEAQGLAQNRSEDCTRWIRADWAVGRRKTREIDHAESLSVQFSASNSHGSNLLAT